jgi:hypothetical protein
LYGAVAGTLLSASRPNTRVTPGATITSCSSATRADRSRSPNAPSCNCELTFACQWIDEIYLPEIIDEGWEATWIVGCGPGRCRRDEICDLPVEEWGEPYWVATLFTPPPPTKTPISFPMSTRKNRPSDRDDRRDCEDHPDRT